MQYFIKTVTKYLKTCLYKSLENAKLIRNKILIIRLIQISNFRNNMKNAGDFA